jgi:biotin synthase-like enzyme
LHTICKSQRFSLGYLHNTSRDHKQPRRLRDSFLILDSLGYYTHTLAIRIILPITAIPAATGIEIAAIGKANKTTADPKINTLAGINSIFVSFALFYFQKDFWKLLGLDFLVDDRENTKEEIKYIS